MANEKKDKPWEISEMDRIITETYDSNLKSMLLIIEASFYGGSSDELVKLMCAFAQSQIDHLEGKI